MTVPPPGRFSGGGILHCGRLYISAEKTGERSAFEVDCISQRKKRVGARLLRATVYLGGKNGWALGFCGRMYALQTKQTGSFCFVFRVVFHSFNAENENSQLTACTVLC